VSGKASQSIVLFLFATLWNRAETRRKSIREGDDASEYYVRLTRQSGLVNHQMPDARSLPGIGYVDSPVPTLDHGGAGKLSLAWPPHLRRGPGDTLVFRDRQMNGVSASRQVVGNEDQSPVRKPEGTLRGFTSGRRPPTCGNHRPILSGLARP
jgi:hypothetical protein